MARAGRATTARSPDPHRVWAFAICQAFALFRPLGAEPRLRRALAPLLLQQAQTLTGSGLLPFDRLSPCSAPLGRSRAFGARWPRNYCNKPSPFRVWAFAICQDFSLFRPLGAEPRLRRALAAQLLQEAQKLRGLGFCHLPGFLLVPPPWGGAAPSARAGRATLGQTCRRSRVREPRDFLPESVDVEFQPRTTRDVADHAVCSGNGFCVAPRAQLENLDGAQGGIDDPIVLHAEVRVTRPSSLYGRAVRRAAMG